MKVLILGGDGMLGHQLFKYFQERHDVRCTLHQDISKYTQYGLYDVINSYTGIDVTSFERVKEVVCDFKPEILVNCIGIIKQQSTAKESIPCLEINALLPHRLALLCKEVGARLIHFSTDCIFSGKKGNYLESDPSDAGDLYGKTKFLGEVKDDICLTLRTSIIGPELSRKKSLLEWFLAQEGTIKGFRKAIYSGFTSLEMSRIIELMLVHPKAYGVYQVSSEPINKYDLCLLFKNKFKHPVEILPDDAFVCDRSLDSTRFRKAFNYTPPSWEEMVDELNNNQ